MTGGQIDQLVFTSVQAAGFDGYQVAAVSPGLAPDELQELAQWGPTHESLREAHPRFSSCNCHSLASSRICVSKTVYAGEEYSRRGGGRVYTQALVMKREVLERFAHNAFRLLQAATAAGYLDPVDDLPEELPTLQLPGRSPIVGRTWLRRVLASEGPLALARVVDSVLSKRETGVVAVRPQALFATVIDLLPLDRRSAIAFTTGLGRTRRRRFQLCAVSADENACDEFARGCSGELVDLRDVAGECHVAPTFQQPWTETIYGFLVEGRIQALQQFVTPESNSRQEKEHLLDDQPLGSACGVSVS